MINVETWRVECDGGAVVEARVWDAVRAFDETRIAVLIVADGMTTPVEFHRDHSRRSAVAWAAGLARLSVASILAPGQLTRAEVEAQLAEALAANANFIEHIEAANGLEIRALKVTT